MARAEWLAVARIPAGLRRREWLELIALAAVLPACRGKHDEPAPSSEPHASAPPPPPTALDPGARRTLEAACARILPAAGGFPGARETNAIEFIDRQLAVPPMQKIAPGMLALAHMLDDAARSRRAVEFAMLAPAAQDEVLDALAHGKLGTKLPEPALFRLLHGFVLEAMFSDPKYGGNAREIGWQAIDFPEPPLREPGGSHGHGM
jgi:hypothetical protein